MANKQEKIIKIGQVTEALPSTFFRVKTEEGDEILAHLSGRMRVNHIRIITGDRVKVEVSPYEQKKGRIVQRM